MFKRTLVRLTIQYTLLLLLIFTIFSGGIYVYMDNTFGGEYRQSSSVRSDDMKATGAAEAAEAGIDQLKYVLLVSYAVLFIVLPFFSYLLAKRALRPVEISFKQQQRFVDDASHELRTPLSILQGELELALNKRRRPAEYESAITTALDEVVRLDKLVHSLLLMARGLRAELYKNIESINLKQLVDRVIALNQQSYADKGLHYKISGDVVPVKGVATLLEQAINNLIDNAAKYSRPSGQITISLSYDETSVMVLIADTGIGMSPRQIDHAFDTFWRADQARAVKGFGLGLPIVRQIARLHHGRIWLASNEAGGMTATLILPRRLSRLSHA